MNHLINKTQFEEKKKSSTITISFEKNTTRTTFEGRELGVKNTKKDGENGRRGEADKVAPNRTGS